MGKKTENVGVLTPGPYVIVEEEPVVIDLKRRSEKFIFIADEHTKEDGTPFTGPKDYREYEKTNRQVMTNGIIFCRTCKKGMREKDARHIGALHVNSDEDPIDYSGHYHLEPGSVYVCPYCGAEHKIASMPKWKLLDRMHALKDVPEGVFYPLNVKTNCTGWAYDECARIIRRPREDGKITLLMCCVKWIPTWYNEKYRLVEKPINYRIVINPETGHTYQFRGLEHGKPSVYSMQSVRMRTVTLLGACCFYDENVRDGLARVLGRYIPKHHMFLGYYLPQMDMFHLEALSRILKDAEYNSHIKKSVKDIKRILDEGNFNSIPRYMRIKSIKKRLAKNIVLYVAYRLLHVYGFKDPNIINSIIDVIDKNVLCTRRLFISPRFRADDIAARNFIKYLIKTREEKGARDILINLITADNHIADTFQDSAHCFNMLIHLHRWRNPIIRGNINEIHDELSRMLWEVEHKNNIIPYNKEELLLEGSYGGYDFRLAKDTHELMTIGREMSICVGGYGNLALDKACTIITMSLRKEYVACVELGKSNGAFKLVQVKARFNQPVREIEPVTQWVLANNIITEGCVDYDNATGRKSSENDARDLPFVN